MFIDSFTAKKNHYPASNFPAQGRLGVGMGDGGKGVGREEGDVGIIYEHSVTPPQVFHTILTFSLPFIDSFIAEKIHYLGD